MKEIINKEVDLVNDEFIVNCIDNTKEERQLVYKFLIDNRNYDKLYLRSNYNVIICNKEGGDSNYNSLENAKETYPEYKVYTFNEFKQKYLNMNKEIIAYKLVKLEFRKAVNSILDKIGNILRQDGITEDYNTHNLLKEAGVLDLWFEPVFSEIEKTLTLSNNKTVKIKKDGVIVEDKLIKIKYIEALFCNTNTFGDTGWIIQYNSFDIGCYKNLTREDLNNILESYKSLK